MGCPAEPALGSWTSQLGVSRRSQSDGSFDLIDDVSLLAFLSRGAVEKPRQDGLPEERNICQLEVLKQPST